MFDIGWGELVLIGIVALIAIGPKELPGVLRSVGQWVAKIRRMAGEFQGQFQEALREAEMSDLKKEVDQFGDAARGLSQYDPLADDNYDGLAVPQESKSAGIEAPAAPPPEQKSPSVSEPASAKAETGPVLNPAGEGSRQ